ncbi:hypothetical protein SAICODRAFT_26747 [Saitoella complicata NRRL Y-17804]|uniref:uncharacterized protein n=1 Tax=Saitoella complicata (strain BCRC 22490 / CBS 7301 / JCM 7358 / NBRC 10748 / NRRL Y-17804) TaxID=698492 RepID=UPI000867B62E|nr:uncharacterized protein SAICODRAFT_26747 [Saitoella complicata NRRL Y-17804]ODQ51309.1 hypothetical protein SAICODRAFT_26747 [Saitoella complicata NRRL Y-17804]
MPLADPRGWRRPLPTTTTHHPPPTGDETFLTEATRDATIRISDLRLGKLLGRGRSSEVYEAWWRDTGERVAVKMIAKSKLTTLPARRDLAKRVELHHELSTHPHILPLHYSFEDAQNVYLILDHAPETLASTSSSSTTLDISVILRHLAEVLAYMHEQGHVHGYLCAENVALVNGDVRVRLRGISKTPTPGTVEDDVEALGRLGWWMYMGPGRRGCVNHGDAGLLERLLERMSNNTTVKGMSARDVLRDEYFVQKAAPVKETVVIGDERRRKPTILSSQYSPLSLASSVGSGVKRTTYVEEPHVKLPQARGRFGGVSKKHEEVSEQILPTPKLPPLPTALNRSRAGTVRGLAEDRIRAWMREEEDGGEDVSELGNDYGKDAPLRSRRHQDDEDEDEDFYPPLRASRYDAPRPRPVVREDFPSPPQQAPYDDAFTSPPTAPPSKTAMEILFPKARPLPPSAMKAKPTQSFPFGSSPPETFPTNAARRSVLNELRQAEENARRRERPRVGFVREELKASSGSRDSALGLSTFMPVQSSAAAAFSNEIITPRPRARRAAVQSTRFLPHTTPLRTLFASASAALTKVVSPKSEFATKYRFQTTGLKGFKQHTKHGLVEILGNDKGVILDLLTDPENTVHIDASGTQVSIIPRHGGGMVRYVLDDLPLRYLPVYRYASRFVGIVRSKSVKLALEMPRGRGRLFLNGDFEGKIRRKSGEVVYVRILEGKDVVVEDAEDRVMWKGSVDGSVPTKWRDYLDTVKSWWRKSKEMQEEEEPESDEEDDGDEDTGEERDMDAADSTARFVDGIGWCAKLGRKWSMLFEDGVRIDITPPGRGGEDTKVLVVDGGVRRESVVKSGLELPECVRERLGRFDGLVMV